MIELSPETKKQLAALQDSFAAGLDARFDEMDAVFATIGDDSRPEDARQSVKSLCDLAHKLVGSAGTFGFGGLSEAARVLESVCETVLKRPDGAIMERRDEIAGLLAALRSSAKSDVG